jgi:hypothetical protein
MGRQAFSPQQPRRRSRGGGEDDGGAGEGSGGSYDDDNDEDDDDDEDDEDDASSNSSSDGSSVIEGRWERGLPLRHAMGMGVLPLRPVRRGRDDGNNGNGNINDINGGDEDPGEDGGEDDDGAPASEDGEEEEGGEDTLPSSWVVAIDSESFEHAVADLEYAAAAAHRGGGGDEIERMVVANDLPYNQRSRRDVATYPHFFRRFVERLDQPHPSQIILRSITFEGIYFDVHEGARPEDLDRLFGGTLPRHRTLEKIEFEGCFLPPRYFERFASALALTADQGTISCPPKALVLEGGVQQVSRGSRFQPVSDLVARGARVSDLALSSDGFRGLEPDEFQLVCSGLERNTNLRTLRVELARADADTLDLALAPASPLQVLHITGCKLEDAAAASLANLLTTNTALVELALTGRIGSAVDPRRLDDIAAVLETSNVTLRRFSDGTSVVWNREHCHHHLVADSRIGKCLRRNQWIHRVLQAWPNYRVPFKGMWPAVLVRADLCPTCLYRFVRRGNLPALCDAVVVAAMASHQAAGTNLNNKKKRRLASSLQGDTRRGKHFAR